MAKIFKVPVDYVCAVSDKRYNINVPDNLDFDLTKLNAAGIEMLIDYYNYLASSEKYKEKTKENT